MVFLVDYQQHKYSDYSDNPAPKTWKIKAASADEAFIAAQHRAIAARTERRYLSVMRTMRTETGELVTSDANYLDEYLAVF